MALTDIRTCPTYVINLDRRPDRWQAFFQQPALSQFTQFQRFSAVEGKNLDVLTDTRISAHTRQNIHRKFRRSHYEICTPGAIGASLSHITLWQNFLKSDAQYLVVFEDDTVVDEKALKYVDLLIPRLPAEWDMWLLGMHAWMFEGKPLNPANPKGWWTVKQFTGAHAYVLSRRGAEILCSEPFPIETHIEYYISACAELKGLKLIRHWALRMTYFAELTEGDDSDTWDSRNSCPVCYIPDRYPQVGFYMSYMRLGSILAAGAALGFVSLAGYVSGKKLASRLT